MKKLEISQMENLQGGLAQPNCKALAFGMGVGLAFAETGVGAGFAGACFIALASYGCI
ncbi:hypothetical protein SAMN05660493_02037 [Epilithonimonas bovis DSM 19482]|uniref:Uncharacterized protein n=1 Tax=Epilithonimonas bovis DSM 19482 TaxID=1121284 RepID=A0A1U7PZH8_9FLAO|nr:hypothetical protein [Epilithonimonas bovis]QIY82273.1 hypothetical protein HER18_01280 [Chryseobacterium sp. NEB161]SIT97321.1 hypothetical protein SAMN05660493_02037 [Epilithonimonas bovis DSM 19482]